MRFALFFATILSITQLSAHNLSDSTLMNWGAEQPRSRIMVYDSVNAAQSGDVEMSKYMAALGEWRQEAQNEGVFESTFVRPFLWMGRQVYVRFERVAAPYTVAINGVRVAHIQNSSLPAEVNITKYALEGNNAITITIDKESKVEPVEGWAKESTQPIMGGWVISQPTMMIRDIAISTKLVDNKLQSHIKLRVKSHALNTRVSTLHYSLHRDDGGLVAFGHKDVTLSMRGEAEVPFAVTLSAQDGWSAESPNLYTLKLRTQHEGRDVEYHNYRVSFRDIGTSEQGLVVNGVHTALNIKNYAGEELLDIKNQGFNTIRIAAGAYDQALYDKCDRIGLYVVSPMPINSSKSHRGVAKGENPSNNPQWLGAYIERVEAGYYTSQIHPCVIAFSLADDSRNGCNLYEGFLRLKECERARPIIYFEAQGEWNTDNLKFTNL